MKLLSGTWSWGEIVTLEVDSKIIKRKVHYGTLEGLYVLINGEKCGKRAFKELPPKGDVHE